MHAQIQLTGIKIHYKTLCLPNNMPFERFLIIQLNYNKKNKKLSRQSVCFLFFILLEAGRVMVNDYGLQHNRPLSHSFNILFVLFFNCYNHLHTLSNYYLFILTGCILQFRTPLILIIDHSIIRYSCLILS